jgi:hypothetical protein
MKRSSSSNSSSTSPRHIFRLKTAINVGLMGDSDHPITLTWICSLGVADFILLPRLNIVYQLRIGIPEVLDDGQHLLGETDNRCPRKPHDDLIHIGIEPKTPKSKAIYAQPSTNFSTPLCPGNFPGDAYDEGLAYACRIDMEIGH